MISTTELGKGVNCTFRPYHQIVADPSRKVKYSIFFLSPQPKISLDTQCDKTVFQSTLSKVTHFIDYRLQGPYRAVKYLKGDTVLRRAMRSEREGTLFIAQRIFSHRKPRKTVI